MQQGRARGRARRGQRGSQSLINLGPEWGGNRNDRPQPLPPDYCFSNPQRFPTPPPAYDDLYRRAGQLAIDDSHSYRDMRVTYDPRSHHWPGYINEFDPPPSFRGQPDQRPQYPEPNFRDDSMKRPGPRYDHEKRGDHKNEFVSKGQSRNVQQSPGACETKPNHGNQNRLSIEALVKALAQMKGHWSNSETLGRLVQHSSKAVKKLVKKNPDTFGCTENETDSDTLIELRPKLLVCEQYVQTSGCRNPAECFNLHLCKFYAVGTCGKGSKCTYGHSWKTDHNMKILKKLHLQDVNDVSVLEELAKKTVKGSLAPRICAFYNGAGCRKADMECSALHICHAYVYSNRLCKATCLLGHDIFARHCVRLLDMYGISKNEAPRDIFQKLNPGPPPCKVEGAKKLRKSGSEGTAEGSKKRSKDYETLELSEASSSSETSYTSDDSSEDENENTKKDPKKKRNRSKFGKNSQSVTPGKDQRKIQKGKNKNSKTKDEKIKNKDCGKSEGKSDSKDKGKAKCITLYSYNLRGDVPIPEICTYSLTGKCFNEKKGCPRLHSKNQVQWQVQVNDTWYNLRAFQGKVLETAYRDVSQDEVTLHAFDPSKVDRESQALIGLLGTSNLKVDFQEMTMQGGTDVKWCVRRLTSFSKTGDVLFFQWFFYDDQKWIKYGAVDSKGRTDLVSDITSDDIERAYLKDDNQALKFKNEKFMYEINFKRMTQKNLQTQTERPIRRRPLIHRNLSTGMKGSSDKDIPTIWEKMSESETYKIVPLTSSEERMNILKMFRLTLPTANLISIERVQSPFQLKAFMNKKKELCLKYSEEEINIQQLFHGTKPESVKDICKENFDWRLYGASHGCSYGKGTYFSNSAAIACGYSSADQNSEKTLFVAQVIVGKVTVGSSSYTRPPSDFDTTVNSISAPTIFVKYDKQEYYPEYLIKFKN